MKSAPPRNAGGNDLRRLNRSRILRLACSQESVSKLEIAQALGISMPTVLQVVRELLEEDLLEEVGAFESTGGRKAKMLAAVAGRKVSIGVDITRNHVGLVLADLRGSVLRHDRTPCAFERSPAWTARLGEMVSNFVREEGLSQDRILGAGVSIPGIVSADGEVITSAHTIGLVGVPTRDIGGAIPWTCVYLNDANAAGTAEFVNPGQPWSGRNAIYLSLSNSVGGAVHLNGLLHAGENQRAGEFGHMCLIPGGLTCYCGKSGCADPYLSALSLTVGLELSLSAFFARLAAGDVQCAERWNTYETHLLRLVNSLRMAFDCDVVLGGYVGGYLTDLLPSLQRRAAELSTFETDGRWLQTCRFKLEASALGAALQHVNAFLDNV